MVRAAAIVLASLLLPAAPAPAEGRLYRIGIVSGQLPGSATPSVQPFTDYLSSRIAGARFEILQLATIEDLLSAADQEAIEFAFCTPAALVEMDVRHGARPIATITQSLAGGGAYPWLAGAVFVRADRLDLRTLADARGQRVMALSPLALGGWLAAVREWRLLGLDEATAFRSVRFDFSYAHIVDDVCAGTADVGVLAAGTFAALSSSCTRGLRVLPAPGGPDARYPAQASTRLYPEAAFAVLTDVDERMVSAVTRELLSIESGSPAATAVTVAGFNAPLSYTPVQELLQELHVRPYESFGRLTFGQAVAQHAGKVLSALLLFLAVLAAAFVRARRLNSRLEASIAERISAEDLRRRLEEHVQHAQRMDSIGRLAGAIAHDFNNMLTVINGYSEMLLEGIGDAGRARTSAEQIRRAGVRAAALTQQLLTFSRKQAVQFSALDLDVVVRESEIMYRRLVGEDITLTLSLAGNLRPVLADRNQMHQVLMNLVVNARDAMPGGGQLVIATGEAEVARDPILQAAGILPGLYAWLEVRDTGVGMDDETTRHIFEPFFSTKGDAGTGLGLATAYGIVKQARGGILVTSAPGAGAAFRVFLPRTGPDYAEADAPVAARAPSGGGRHRVLVVEDQDDVRQFVRDVLESRGYDVLQADSGGAALAIARRQTGPIHLLITDVVLGGMNGGELAAQMLQLRPETRVLFTSGYPDDEMARRGVSGGRVAFLAKPYTIAQLAATVAETLGSGIPL